jgi:autotransporter-associated beta strand protein
MNISTNNNTKSILSALPSWGRASFVMGVLVTAAFINAPWAHAQTYTYVGPASNLTAWSDTTNWSPNGIPNAIGDEIIQSGAAIDITQNLPSVTLGTIRMNGSGFNLRGPVTLNQDGAGAGSALIINSSTVNGAPLWIRAPVVVADDLVVTQDNATAAVVNGVIRFASGGSTSGTGNVTFNNKTSDINWGSIWIATPFTVAGNYTIASGAVRTDSTWGSATGINLGVTNGTSATLIANFGGLATSIVVAATSGTNLLGSTDATSTTFSGPITLNGNLTVSSRAVQTAGTDLGVNLSGNISGAGGLFINGGTVRDTGANVTTVGSVKMSGTNTFTGDTRIANGTLYIKNAQSLQNSTVNLHTSDAGALAFGSTTTVGLASATFGGLSGSRNLLLEDTLTSPGAVALSIGNNNNNAGYAGNLTGSGSLTKIGTGTQTLSGSNSYSGSTTVAGGALIVNGSLGSSSVTVNSGAMLGGDGTIAGTTTISGTHSPGNSPGLQTFSSDLTYTSGASVIWELEKNTLALDGRGVDYDGIDVGGNLDFSGPVSFNLVFNGAGSAVTWSDALWATDYLGTSGWLVYSLTGSGSIANFTNLSLVTIDWADSATNSLSSVRSEASFSLFQDGNEIYLNYTAVPEPSTYALLGLAAAAVAGYGARRRKRAGN